MQVGTLESELESLRAENEALTLRCQRAEAANKAVATRSTPEGFFAQAEVEALLAGMREEMRAHRLRSDRRCEQVVRAVK